MEPLILKLNPEWNSYQDSNLCLLVGSALENGTLFQKDPAAAAVLYREALRTGNAEGGYALGRLYENGIGVEKNLQAAKSAYLQAATMGNAPAMLALGILFEDADLPELAVRWYKAGHEAGLAEASHHYALCLFRGYGTKQDKAAAFPIFRTQANRGFTGSAYFAGLCYHQGIGTPVDYLLARHFYQAGADDGDPYCWNQLGAMALEGLLGERDVHQALNYFLRAGKLGFGKAYANAAWLYQTGAFGGGPDMKRALYFYKLAAENGAEDVARQLQWIEDHRNGKYWKEDFQNGIVVIDDEFLDDPEDPEEPEEPKKP